MGNLHFTLRDAPSDILSVGEILIDMISDSYAVLTDDTTFKAHFGGSPANLCMNVNRLGGKANLIASVGQDPFGEFLISKLKAKNIDTQNIQQSSSSTSMVIVNKSIGTPIPIFYRGADYDLTFNESFKSKLEESKILHITSWPISQPQSREVINQAIDYAKDLGVVIGFDPNYHESLWNGEDGKSVIKSFISKVDLIKPSEDDAERLFGNDTPENQIDKFHELGCRFVIMTLGEKGIIVSCAGEKRYYDAKKTEVVDTTGAGDAFWAGLYTGLIKGEPFEQTLELGLATSAYKLRYVGATVDLPHYSELIERK